MCVDDPHFYKMVGTIRDVYVQLNADGTGVIHKMSTPEERRALMCRLFQGPGQLCDMTRWRTFYTGLSDMVLISNRGIQSRKCVIDDDVNEAASALYRTSRDYDCVGAVDTPMDAVFTGTVVVAGVETDGQWMMGPYGLATTNVRWLRKRLDLTGSVMWSRLTHTRIPRPRADVLLGTFLMAMERLEVDGVVVTHYSMLEDLIACGTWADYQLHPRDG